MFFLINIASVIQIIVVGQRNDGIRGFCFCSNNVQCANWYNNIILGGIHPLSHSIYKYISIHFIIVVAVICICINTIIIVTIIIVVINIIKIQSVVLLD